MTIHEERAAFDALLPNLLLTHAGKWVLGKDGKVVDFFSTAAEAYEAGVFRFYPNVFLVTRVERRRTAWMPPRYALH